MKTRQWLSTDAVRFEVGELGGDTASGSAVPILPCQLHTDVSSVFYFNHSLELCAFSLNSELYFEQFAPFLLLQKHILNSRQLKRMTQTKGSKTLLSVFQNCLCQFSQIFPFRIQLSQTVGTTAKLFWNISLFTGSGSDIHE